MKEGMALGKLAGTSLASGYDDAGDKDCISIRCLRAMCSIGLECKVQSLRRFERK